METKNTKKGKVINLNQVLIVQPPRRSSVDIGKWRSLEKSALSGRRSAYYDMMDDLLNDTVLGDAVDKRVRAITNSEILFQKDKKEVEAMTDFIDTEEFELIVTEMMNTKFYGKTVIELYWENGVFKPYCVPRKHLNTNLKRILKSTSDSDGIPYENDDFLLNIGDDTNLGLFNKTAPFAIFKRNGGADYAQYCEQEGIPQMVGRYDPEDDNGREEMETAFKNRGSGGSMTMSKNSEVDVLTAGAGNSEIHGGFLKWCDEQIIIGINSQTMTTKDGSSYAQAKVHGDTEDDLNQADRRYIQRLLNSQLLPRLEKRGYPVKGGKFVFAEKGEKLTKKQQLEIAQTVDNLTSEGVADEYFYETFNLPKGKGKTDQNVNGKTPEDIEDEDDLKTKKKKKSKKVTVKKLSLKKRIADFFANAPR